MHGFIHHCCEGRVLYRVLGKRRKRRLYMSIIVHRCGEAQRTAKQLKGKRSDADYVQSHRERREKRNGLKDFLGLYLVALNSHGNTEKPLTAQTIICPVRFSFYFFLHPESSFFVNQAA